MSDSKPNFHKDYKYLSQDVSVALPPKSPKKFKQIKTPFSWVSWLRILSILFWIVVFNSVYVPKTYQIKLDTKKTDTLIKTLPISNISYSATLPEFTEEEETTTLLTKEPEKAESEFIAETIQWKEISVETGDNLSTLFQKQGISANEVFTLLELPRAKQLLPRLRPGQTLQLLQEADGKILQIKYPINVTDTLHIHREGDKFREELIAKTMDIYKKYAIATIDDSLFLAGKRAGMSDRLIMNTVNMFGWDIDFSREVRAGDQFSLLYEEKWLGDEKIANGDILMAEFINRGNTIRAIRYTDSDGNTGYYTPEGYSMQKAFIRNPVEFSRISSRFSTARKHPVLNVVRAHRGVDYAAPTGTPIKAAGNGKIEHIGDRGGLGKAIIIDHGRGYKTVYGHMSRFAKSLRKGSNVKQGQVIGYVGSTGLASGPHLHFEFHINGVHHDPLSVNLPKSNPIAEKHKTDFLNFAKKITEEWEQHKANVG